MGIYQQKLPSGKIRIFIKGQVNGVSYWETVESIEKGENREKELRGVAELKSEDVSRFKLVMKKLKKPVQKPRDAGAITLESYIKTDYLPYCKRSKPANYEQEKRLITRALIPYFSDMTLTEIDPRLVRAWQLQRTETKTRHGKERKLSTVNREIAVLSQIFTLAVNDELIERNPCLKVKRFPDEPHRVEYLTREEEKSLLAACTGARAFLHAYILVGVYTGLRPGKSELFGLKVEHCDFSRNQIILEKHKTAKRTGQLRIIPMNSQVRTTLFRLCDGKQGDDFVFYRKRNPAPYKRFFKAFKRAAEIAKLPDSKSIPYILRHTFGTRLAEAGIGVAEIKDLMGHKNILMTMRYVHPTQAAKHAAVERLIETGVSSEARQEPESQEHPPQNLRWRSAKQNDAPVAANVSDSQAPQVSNERVPPHEAPRPVETPKRDEAPVIIGRGDVWI